MKKSRKQEPSRWTGIELELVKLDGGFNWHKMSPRQTLSRTKCGMRVTIYPEAPGNVSAVKIFRELPDPKEQCGYCFSQNN